MSSIQSEQVKVVGSHLKDPVPTVERVDDLIAFLREKRPSWLLDSGGMNVDMGESGAADPMKIDEVEEEESQNEKPTGR